MATTISKCYDVNCELCGSNKSVWCVSKKEKSDYYIVLCRECIGELYKIEKEKSIDMRKT